MILKRTVAAAAIRTLAASLALVPAACGAQEKDDDARLALGREVFAERAMPQCPICHSLADAAATGAVGPDLDSLRPDYDRVMAAVVNGIGPMTPYDALGEDELDALAHYVSTVSGG